MAYIDPTMFEVIQPIAGGIAHCCEPLPKDGQFGQCFHHHAVAATNRADLEAVRAELIANEHPIVFGGECGESAYFYADARKDLEYYCEYVYLTPEYDQAITRN